MSNNGNFTEQIDIACQKAKDMCSWVLRTFKDRSIMVMKTLWSADIQPILDYCSQLWCPIQTSFIPKIEQIQQSFTRKIKLVQDHRLDYWERLKSLIATVLSIRFLSPGVNLSKINYFHGVLQNFGSERLETSKK